MCSPLHPLMNLSFLVLGCTMFLGSSLVRQQFSANRATTVGMAALAIAGVGVALVGLFPENTVASVHTIGSALPFAVGNAGIFVLGVALELPALWRVYTLCTGAFSLAALALFVSHVYVGVGEGGMERAVAYPQTVWLIALGIYLLRRKKAEGSHRKVTNSDDGGHRVSL